jgi:hypothetical protein
MKDITLSLMVARTDVLWIKPMLEHLCKAHRNSVSKIAVFVDTAPLGPSFKNRPGVGTLDELYKILHKTQKERLIDEIKEIKYDASIRKEIYRRHFGYDIGVTHDFRGYPIFGIIQTLEQTDSDLVLHFDSDILFYRNLASNWLDEAVQLLESREEVMFVAPHPGPPRYDGELNQKGLEYTKHDSFFTFKKFSSRIFLFSKKKFQDMLPMKPLPISWKRLLWQKLTKKSAYLPWETIISNRLKTSKYFRAGLSNNEYWTLHTPDHGPEFVKNLPEIIRKVESGWFPESQAGDYDMILKEWI